jgi:type III secretory pathway component EscV
MSSDIINILLSANLTVFSVLLMLSIYINNEIRWGFPGESVYDIIH